ncbi:MAG TPA: SLC13 family permease [Bacillales bacterium]|nr:SLC13 family permease [Bacillales bacterium]
MFRQSLHFIFAFLLYVLFVSPVIFHWNGMIQAFALLVLAQILWTGGVLPAPVTSLLLMLLVSFHFFTFEKTLSFLGSDVVWLLFSTYIIAGAFLNSGLAHRLSLYVLRFSKGSIRFLLFMFMMLGLFLALCVPSNVGRGNMLVSVLEKVSLHVNKWQKAQNISKTLFIASSYIVSIGGAAVVTGANSTLYAFSMFQSISSLDLNYLNWMLLFMPPIVVFIVLLWMVFMLVFPPEKIDTAPIISFVDAELARIGSVSGVELRTIAIIGVTIFLWILQPLHGYSISMIGLFGAVLTMLPAVGVWKWEDAKKQVNWGMLLFFASTLLLSRLLIRSGALEWVAENFFAYFSFHHLFAVLLVLLIATVILRTFFVSLLGFMTIMIPLSLEIGSYLGETSSLLLTMAVYLAGVPGFFLVTQSPVHMIYYSYGNFSEKDLFRVGTAVAGIWLAIIAITVHYYWAVLL